MSIGGRTAVGEVFGIPLRGKLGWLLWRSILLYYLPTWDRRLRLLADWLIWPVVGRDVVELDHTARQRVRRPPPGVRRRRGACARSARPVREVHVILEGDVDASSARAKSVEALHPGGHFGRKVLKLRGADEARARAHTRADARAPRGPGEPARGRARVDRAHRRAHRLDSHARARRLIPIVLDRGRPTVGARRRRKEGEVKRFVPAKTTRLSRLRHRRDLHHRRRSLPRQGRARVLAALAGDGAVGRLLLDAHRLRLGQQLRERARALDADALTLDAAFALSVGLSPGSSAAGVKGGTDWAPQTFAMSSELFFALTTKLDPE